jgi:hypothetical protein
VDSNGISPFFIVCARDRQNVKEKILELERMNVPFVIVCGEKINHPNVAYRKAMGKWDAINFGAKFVPKEADVIVFNDVDTRIHNFEYAFQCLNSKVDLVYCQVKVSEGPQVKFYRILDPMRKSFHVCASGELMLVKKRVFEHVMPIPPCMAEDSYILFKALELGYRAHFCTRAFVTTSRTVDDKEEEAYKTRTTLGIYQALEYVRPPPWIRIFYALLPITAPSLAIVGKDGRVWVRGINKAVKAHVMKMHPTRF